MAACRILKCFWSPGRSLESQVQVFHWQSWKPWPLPCSCKGVHRRVAGWSSASTQAENWTPSVSRCEAEIQVGITTPEETKRQRNQPNICLSFYLMSWLCQKYCNLKSNAIHNGHKSIESTGESSLNHLSIIVGMPHPPCWPSCCNAFSKSWSARWSSTPNNSPPRFANAYGFLAAQPKLGLGVGAGVGWGSWLKSRKKGS